MTSAEQHTLDGIRQQLADLQTHIDAIKTELQAEYDRVLTAKGEMMQPRAPVDEIMVPDGY